ncbi:MULTISPECIES: UvrD-helicase domain-containing protein [unclassified Clostridium]|uniref:UvrD-helicase domain-containing protein n=1 Tax=unclassified Clostridium TaxID=2614128 RepID=UPI00207A4B13|nr:MULTISPECIES: UvrD-helicase domain-containing protein [unclassified Clostridium]
MARKVINIIKKCLDENRNFLLEAGAGAGKTYTLMQTIEYLQEQENNDHNILCITYTNVAKDEIQERLKVKSGITVNTMHEFIWGYINKYQLELKKEVLMLIEKDIEDIKSKIDSDSKLIEKPRKNTNIEKKKIDIEKNERKLEKYQNLKLKNISYESYKALHNGIISHDEVLMIFCKFLKNDLFAKLFINNFSHIFIDEYQDTSEDILIELLECINKYKGNQYMVIGLFGDCMQQIYSNNSLKIDYEKYKIEVIPKMDNFRTCQEIILANNILRMDGLKQDYRNKSIKLDKIQFIYNLNNDIYLKNYNEIDINQYKRLFLSHKEIASELGFRNISEVFSNEFRMSANDKLLKMEDSFIKIIMEMVITIFNHFIAKNYASIIARYNSERFTVKELDKLKNELEKIIKYNGNLKDIIEKLKRLNLLNEYKINKIVKKYKDRGKIDFINKLYDIELKEYCMLYSQIYGQTNLQTLHGVKGDEFDKVIVNIRGIQQGERSWTKYSFDKFFLNGLEDTPQSINTHKLLYVACTRAKSSLVINYMASNKEEEHISKAFKNIKKLFGNYIEIKKY